MNINEIILTLLLFDYTFQLHPMILFQTKKDGTFYIDNEDYELKPIQIRLLSQSITVFCPESNS